MLIIAISAFAGRHLQLISISIFKQLYWIVLYQKEIPQMHFPAFGEFYLRILNFESLVYVPLLFLLIVIKQVILIIKHIGQ